MRDMEGCQLGVIYRQATPKQGSFVDSKAEIPYI